MARRVSGRRKKSDPKTAPIDRMLQDYLRYMDDFEESRPGRARQTDPAPGQDLPSHKRPTIPDEPEDEAMKQIRSDVRAKQRERRVTTKAKKGR